LANGAFEYRPTRSCWSPTDTRHSASAESTTKGACADGDDYRNGPLTQATRPIIDQDWQFYTEAVARLLLGWSEPEAARRFVGLMRESTTPEMAHTALAATCTGIGLQLCGNPTPAVRETGSHPESSVLDSDGC
jgi:hypothetical protein